MTYPFGLDYYTAIQNPRFCFADPDLAHGLIGKRDSGTIWSDSGNFAIVFRVSNGHTTFAVRCFTQDVADRRDRYPYIAQAIRISGLPYFADFDYIERGIRLQGRWFPILKMEWIDGDLLRPYIQRHTSDPNVLLDLANHWQEMCASLARVGIAHGDLQHGNVMISNGLLKLVDYDGMFVPSLRGKASNEEGHNNYQHPHRKGHHYDSWIDGFSASSIMVSLLALSVDPTLLHQAQAGDEALLFNKDDYTNPSSSVTFELLKNHPDARLRHMGYAFENLVHTPIHQIPPPTKENLGFTAITSVPVRFTPRRSKPFTRQVSMKWSTRVNNLVASALSISATASRYLYTLGQTTARHTYIAYLRLHLAYLWYLIYIHPTVSDITKWLLGIAIRNPIPSLVVIGVAIAFVRGLNKNSEDAPPRNTAPAVSPAAPKTLQRASALAVKSSATHPPLPSNDPRIPMVLSSPAATAARASVPGHGLPVSAGSTAGQEALLELTSEVKQVFRWIPAGSFTMGSDLEERRWATSRGQDQEAVAGETPQRRVTFSSGFWMAETEVTRAHFAAFVSQTGHRTTAEFKNSAWGLYPKKVDWVELSQISWRAPGFSQSDTEPVVCVSWDDAMAYCQWLTSESGLHIALPTEAQWEYACRAKSEKMFTWVSNEAGGQRYLNALDTSANDILAPYKQTWTYRFPFDDGFSYTAPVGTFRRNAWGLRDMHGNVNEWCIDWYAPYDPRDITDPSGPTSGTTRVLRGGSWLEGPAACRSAYRQRGAPDYRANHLGFRVVWLPTQ